MPRLSSAPASGTGPGGALLKSGLYVTSPASALTTAIYANQEMTAAPLLLSETGAIDRIAIGITSGGEAGSTVALAIFDDSHGYPASRVVNGGTVVATGTGVVEATVSATLTAGLYWLAALYLNAATTRPTVRAVQAGAFWWPAGTASQVITGANSAGYGATGQASMPTTFPAAQGPTWNVTRVAVRAV